jgi:predicted ThiF/HesA family dinucleotide-utilizing enzyme
MLMSINLFFFIYNFQFLVCWFFLKEKPRGEMNLMGIRLLALQNSLDLVSVALGLTSRSTESDEQQMLW